MEKNIECPIKFDELEWKENPYGKTCKLYQLKYDSDNETSLVDLMYYPTLTLWCVDCTVVKKQVNGSICTYDIKISDKDGSVLLGFEGIINDIRKVYPSLQPIYHKFGYTYLKVKSSDKNLFDDMSIKINSPVKIKAVYLFVSKE